MERCPAPLEICMVGINHTQKKVIIFHPDCKKWSCPYCSVRNAGEWIHQGIRGSLLLTMQGEELRMVTITSRASITPNKSLYFFSQNWPRLNQRMKYHGEKLGRAKPEYFLVPERHKSGVLHFHMLTTSPLKERWYKDNAPSVGFGYMAKAEPLRDALLAATYVSKYLMKSIDFAGWPKGFRRVRVSRGWPMSKPEKKPGWEWSGHSEKSAWFEKYLYNDAGYHILDKREQG